MTSGSPRSRRLRNTLAVVPAAALVATGVLTAIPSTAQAAAPAATPNTTKLAGALAKQTLTWGKCDFKNASYNTRFANIPNVQCATVKVPRDWHNAGNGKTWDIKISQAKNIDAKNPRYKGTIFANPGGPGGEGLVWGPAMQERTPDLNPYYNYVGFDPRGVGQSSKATCLYKFDPTDKTPYAQQKAIGRDCSANEDVKTINTEQTTYDMDFIRALLKAPKLSYIGYSYGTWLGTWYENIFAANGDKFVLDSAIDATSPTLQRTWDLQPIARDRQFKMHLMNWIARQDATFHLGTDANKIYEKYWAASAKMQPYLVNFAWSSTGGFNAFPNNELYPSAANAVNTIIQWGGEAATANSKASPAAQTDAFFAKMIANAPTPAARTSAQRARTKLAPLKSLTPRSHAAKAKSFDGAAEYTYVYTDVFDMIRCNDGQWTQGAAYWENWAKKTQPRAPLTAQVGGLGVPTCAFWRTNNMMPAANPATFPKTIVGQGELDSQTAYEGGFTSGTKLPNTSGIFIDNEGSHGHFPYGTECYDRPIYNYFLKNKQPKPVTVCQGLPLPKETSTFETWGKLNKKGKETPVNGGPFTPAATAVKVAKPIDITIEDPQTQQLLRQAVEKIYGQPGVDALKRNGTLK